MESPFAKLFLEIQAHIQDQVPEIKFIDQNLAQYLHDEKRKQMLFPCVLIDFVNTDYTALQGEIQLAQATIALSLFFDIWNNTSNLTPQAIKEAGLNYLEIEHKVFSCLQGFSGSFTSPLVRTNQKSQNANELGLIIKEMTFTTSFEDWTVAPPDNYIGLSLGFSVTP